MKEEWVKGAKFLGESSGVDDAGAKEADGERVVESEGRVGRGSVGEEGFADGGVGAVGSDQKGSCCGGLSGEVGRNCLGGVGRGGEGFEGLAPLSQLRTRSASRKLLDSLCCSTRLHINAIQ